MEIEKEKKKGKQFKEFRQSLGKQEKKVIEKTTTKQTGKRKKKKDSETNHAGNS